MPEKVVFRELVMDPIERIIEKSKNKREELNACFKYHAFWSVMHGLISIKLTGSSDFGEELNKCVLTDAIEGFIKNLE